MVLRDVHDRSILDAVRQGGLRLHPINPAGLPGRIVGLYPRLVFDACRGPDLELHLADDGLGLKQLAKSNYRAEGAANPFEHRFPDRNVRGTYHSENGRSKKSLPFLKMEGNRLGITAHCGLKGSSIF